MIDRYTIKRLDIEILDVSISGVTLEKCTLTFTTNIINPTDATVHDLTVLFDVYITNDYIGEGSSDIFTLQGKKTVNTTVPVTIYYKNLTQAIIDLIKDLIAGKTTTLTIKGIAYASIFFGLFRTSHAFEAQIIKG